MTAGTSHLYRSTTKVLVCVIKVSCFDPRNVTVPRRLLCSSRGMGAVWHQTTFNIHLRLYYVSSKNSFMAPVCLLH